MPKSVDCELRVEDRWELIGIGHALTLPRGEVMRCVDCGGRVRAHKTGTTGQEAHFEHRKSHEGCPRSHKFDGDHRPHPSPID